MDRIVIKNLWFDSYVNYYVLGRVREICCAIDLTFESGNIYCIDCNLSYGGWAISWATTGNIKPEQGNIYFDDKEMNQKDLKQFCCSVGLTGYEGTFYEKRTVRKLLTKSIANNPDINSIEELKEPFMLQEGRFDRGIRCYSNERWRATMAIGYGAGKRVFGFPWLWPEYVNNYKDAWMKKVFSFIKSQGGIIILPTIYSGELSDLFDKVVKVGKSHSGTTHGANGIEIIDV